MMLCTVSDLKDFLLPAYIEACEGQNPGVTERNIIAVSGEVKDLLVQRYPQPWPNVPAIIRYIASVIAAYRTVEAITTLVSTEGTTENEWLPLQKEWKHATDMLKDIAAGRVKIPITEEYLDREDATVFVSSPKPVFDFKGF